MENKKVDTNNIFESVVLESADKAEANAVLIVNLVIAVRPVTDSDLKCAGLNQ